MHKQFCLLTVLAPGCLLPSMPNAKHGCCNHHIRPTVGLNMLNVSNSLSNSIVAIILAFSFPQTPSNVRTPLQMCDESRKIIKKKGFLSTLQLHHPNLACTNTVWNDERWGVYDRAEMTTNFRSVIERITATKLSVGVDSPLCWRNFWRCACPCHTWHTFWRCLGSRGQPPLEWVPYKHQQAPVTTVSAQLQTPWWQVSPVVQMTYYQLHSMTPACHRW